SGPAGDARSADRGLEAGLKLVPSEPAAFGRVLSGIGASLRDRNSPISGCEVGFLESDRGPNFDGTPLSEIAVYRPEWRHLRLPFSRPDAGRGEPDRLR